MDNEIDMKLDLFVQHSIYRILKESSSLVVETEGDLLTDFDGITSIDIYDYKGHFILTLLRCKREYLVDGHVKMTNGVISIYKKVNNVGDYKCVIAKFINTIKNNLEYSIIDLMTIDDLSYYLLQRKR